MMRWRINYSLVARLLSLFLLSACQAVAPWEREILAKEEMAWTSDPLLDSLDQQVYFSKEGASGGLGAAGGGCGCN